MIEMTEEAEGVLDVQGLEVSTGQETPGSNAEALKDSVGDNSEVSVVSDIPVMKRYAHHGKRRRSYTDELFRCPIVDMISRTPLVCNHLLWRNKAKELRDHLTEHMKVEDVQKLSDSQVQEHFTEAKRIFLQGIPEDVDDEDSETEGDPEDV